MPLQKDTLALQVQLVFTQPTTIQVLAVISCEGHGLYFLPLNCKGEPLTDPEREIPFNAVRTGEVIGSGAAGTVYKTTYNNQLVAVKRVRLSSSGQRVSGCEVCVCVYPCLLLAR